MEKKINFKDAYLILHSDKAVELYDSLNQSGLLWETLSTLFNNHAIGKDSHGDLVTKADLSMILSELRQLKFSNDSGATGGITPFSPSFTPHVQADVGESTTERRTPLVKKRSSGGNISPEQLAERAQKLKDQGGL